MEMEPQRLRATIASAQAGSADGFEAILEAYGSRLYGYFLRTSRNHHDAEDLLGELMLRLVRRLRSYDERGRFEPWLFRIAANIVRDYIRRQKSRPTAASLSAEDEMGSPLAEQLAGFAGSADAGIEAAEVSAQLNDALAKLAPTVRQMILLRHFGEMSFKEIAELFDCPLGTVLARVHRGLKKLRHLMDESSEHK